MILGVWPLDCRGQGRSRQGKRSNRVLDTPDLRYCSSLVPLQSPPSGGGMGSGWLGGEPEAIHQPTTGTPRSLSLVPSVCCFPVCTWGWGLHPLLNLLL